MYNYTQTIQKEHELLNNYKINKLNYKALRRSPRRSEKRLGDRLGGSEKPLGGRAEA